MSISQDTLITDGPEALQWLRTNGHEAALASNRFRSTTEALLFVEQLYSAGARTFKLAWASLLVTSFIFLKLDRRLSLIGFISCLFGALWALLAVLVV